MRLSSADFGRVLVALVLGCLGCASPGTGAAQAAPSDAERLAAGPETGEFGSVRAGAGGGVKPSPSHSAHEAGGQEDAEPEEGTANASSSWPLGTKVLHIGDSFAGALGIPLGKELEARGISSVLKTKDASYLTDWAWDGNLQKYVWKFNPDLVLITLGGNELGIAHPEERRKTVQKLVATLEGRPCVWVAIPLWNGPQNGLLEVIRDSSSPCHFLDTNRLMDTAHMPRIKDGVHPTAQAREAWARLVLAWLTEHRAPTAEKPWNLRD